MFSDRLCDVLGVTAVESGWMPELRLVRPVLTLPVAPADSDRVVSAWPELSGGGGAHRISAK